MLGDYLLQQLIGSEFIQKKLTQILISLTTNFISIHIVSILSSFLTINPYIDFFTQIFISSCMSLNINIIYDVTNRYENEIHKVTQYIINNYNIENYMRWKKICVFSGSIYLAFVLLFIDINNKLLRIYLIQYLISYIIIENFENKTVYNWIYNINTKPVVKIDAPPILIDSYISYQKNTLVSNIKIRNIGIVDGIKFSRNKIKLKIQ